MNPLTNVKNIKKLSEQELKLGGKSSWHDQYKDSAWIFVGGLPYDLTEGDIICVFSQYGEIVHINLVRDKETGKQKGYCFLCYEDQRSTILAVDNLNGIKILNRTLRVDHVQNYKAPKESKKNPIDEETKLLREEGCAPLSTIAQYSGSNKLPTQIKEMANNSTKLPPRLEIEPIKSEKPDIIIVKSKKSKKKVKKEKKEKKKKSKKEKKSKKRKRKYSTSSSSSSSSSSDSDSSSSDSSDSSDEVKRKKKKSS